MESLESKLDRLTPDQRKEIEDFVDFLLYRSGNLPVAHGAAQSPVSRQNVASLPLILQEPVHIMENTPLERHDSSPVENSFSPLNNEERATPIQEIIVGGEDPISRDYMDYGSFEKNPSPATIAVKTVKEKLQKREEQEKPRVSLDWIE
ncbi:MAG TPA: hypothetical protein VFC43_06950 [Methanoregula sp.]|nr:hypothetical protein [Methanoregula sp.]